MRLNFSRRSILAGVTGLAMARSVSASAEADPVRQLTELERKSAGRLGVSVIDTGSGKRIEYRAGERFPLCSTFKVLAASAVLARVDQKSETLDKRIVFQEKDLVDGSPVTKERVGGNGMTVGELCHAAMTVSDNTAGNLLLRILGGPEGLTAYARTLGDSVTRLDRYELELNEAKPGDPRDTTSPAAMLSDLSKIVLGEALSPGCRAQMKSWLLASTTGGERLRAGMPRDWQMGDKTGTGSNGVTNDVGIVWPPNRQPIVIAAYLAESPASVDERNVVMSEIGRIVATTI